MKRFVPKLLVLACLSAMALSFTLVSTSVYAAAKPESGKSAEGKEGEKKAEKPHEPGLLDPRFDLGIWTIVVFGGVLLVLKKFAWSPMLDGLKKREGNIQQAIEDAKKAREDAETLRVSLKKEMDQASAKVADMMAEARRDAAYTAEQTIAKAKAEIEEERARMKHDLETAKDQAIKQMQQHSVQLATLMSEKAVRKHLSDDDHRRLIEEALADLRKATDDRKRQFAGYSS